MSNKARLTSLSVLTRAANAGKRQNDESDLKAVLIRAQISKIRVKAQVRKRFDNIEEFAARIAQIGEIQTPIMLRAIKNSDEYELVAGERRVRASVINGWPDILARVFPVGTSDLEIRQTQVSENIDRANLSLREMALGLAEDEAKYGRSAAARIWAPADGPARSKSWMSKHLRFLRFGPITRTLFDDDLFDDVEAAHKLDDIEAIAPDVANELATGMRNGQRESRLTLEKRLRELKHERVDLEEAAPDVGASGPTLNQLKSSDARGGAGVEDPKINSNQPEINQTPEQTDAGNLDSYGNLAIENIKDIPSNKSVPRGKKLAPQASVLLRSEELYQLGTSSLNRFRALETELFLSNADTQTLDWRIWVAFIDVVASALSGISPAMAGKIMLKFNAELNSKGPLELLNGLHPPGKSSVMPDDFGYDTDRNTFPLAPREWTL